MDLMLRSSCRSNRWKPYICMKNLKIQSSSSTWRSR